MDTTGAGRAAGKRWRIGSGLAIAAVAVAGLVPLVGAEAHRGAAHGAAAAPSDKVLLFAADGMRQDAVEKYAAQGRMPGMRELLRRGAKASGNGLLTQAPPNTGAGWNTLATGAWPGVTGATNNTFHISGTDFDDARRAGSTRACSRPRRSPSRRSATARRWRRSSGPAAAAP